MSLVTQLGLQEPDGELLACARAQWARWQSTHPDLAVTDDLLGLRAWVDASSRPDSNRVLLALAELGAVDGGDDPAATAALLWLLLPGGVSIAWALRHASDRIDELVASQLWISARTVNWRRPNLQVAATVLMNTQRQVLQDLGLAGRRERPVPPEAFDALTNLGDEAARTAVEDAVVLHKLLADARAQGVVNARECRLLLRLTALVDTPHVDRGRGGLLTRAATAFVAAETGLSQRTVFRQASRALLALRGTYGQSAHVA